MRKIIILFILSAFYIQINAQESNLVKYFPGFRLKDGVYLTFLNFKENKPILPDKFLSGSSNTNSFYFYDNLFQSNYLYLLNSKGDTIKISTKLVWGYCSNNSVFIQLNGRFNRIYQLGALAHFVGTKIVVDNSYIPANGYWNAQSFRSSTTREQTQEFMLDFESGQIIEFNVKNLLALLKRDDDLFNEYNNLKNKKKEQLKFLYLRKFNQRNPIFFPLE